MKKTTKKNKHMDFDKLKKAKLEELSKRQTAFLKDLEKIQKKHGMVLDIIPAKLGLISKEEIEYRMQQREAEMKKKDLTKEKK